MRKNAFLYEIRTGLGADCPKEHQLRQLSRDFPQFRYFPCLSEEQYDAYNYGMVLDIALENSLNIKESRVFLCGHPEMVKSGRIKMFMLIHLDSLDTWLLWINYSG